MGAWGSGSFENDDALDWADALGESTDASILLEAFQAVLAVDYVEAPDAAVALAAAEVVAAARGSPTSELPPSVALWLGAHSDAVGTETVRTAIAAVDRVAAPHSELRELWIESGDREWQTAVADLQRRLTHTPQQGPEHTPRET